MGNYTNKCTLFSTPSGQKANEWIYQAVAFSDEGQMLCYIITEKKGKSHRHSFNLHSTLAVQIYANFRYGVWRLIGQSMATPAKPTKGS